MIITQAGISLWFLTIQWNGLLVALGIAAGFLLTVREAKYHRHDTEIVYELFLPLILWGTIGARVWHILTPPLSSVELGLTSQYYFSHPLDALALWQGGLGVPGALIGGLFALFIYARKNGFPFRELTDLFAPGAALAQSLGRLGNFFNQELYGLPTNIPWKIFIDPPHRLMGYETAQYYHPLFAYEALLNFVNLTLLIWLSRRRIGALIPGDLFFVYLGFYSFARFFLEFLRLDAALVNGVNINQIFFAIMFLFAVVGLSKRKHAVQRL